MNSPRRGESLLKIGDLGLQRLRRERLLEGLLFELSNCRVLFMQSGPRLGQKPLCSFKSRGRCTPRRAATTHPSWLRRKALQSATLSSNSPRCGVQSTAPPAPKAFDAEKYLTTLDPEHESLTPRPYGNGKPDTRRASSWQPSRGARGSRASWQSRSKTRPPPFPRTWTQGSTSIGGYRLQMGDVQLLRSPLDVLMASEHGITNCIAFLTEKISVEQLFYLFQVP